jgi:hypothetical protein
LNRQKDGYSIIWRRLDQPGHEFSRLSLEDGCYNLSGTAIFIHDTLSCKLDYTVWCDSGWQTFSAKVTGRVGMERVNIEVSVDTSRRWRLNGQEVSKVEGCFDLDLNFSPSTNLLPIRRLGLEIGQREEVQTAWLRFPDFILEPLEQVYHRVDRATYRYESGRGRFVTELLVNEQGFVVLYPNFWEEQKGQPGLS